MAEDLHLELVDWEPAKFDPNIADLARRLQQSAALVTGVSFTEIEALLIAQAMEWHQ